jgi:hypothetical protein
MRPDPRSCPSAMGGSSASNPLPNLRVRARRVAAIGGWPALSGCAKGSCLRRAWSGACNGRRGGAVRRAGRALPSLLKRGVHVRLLDQLTDGVTGAHVPRGRDGLQAPIALGGQRTRSYRVSGASDPPPLVLVERSAPAGKGCARSGFRRPPSPQPVGSYPEGGRTFMRGDGVTAPGAVSFALR